VGLDLRHEGEILNLGNPEEISILGLAHRVREVVGRDVPIRHVPARRGDPRQRQPVIEAIQAAYGWRPQVDLETGLRRTLEAWRTEGEPKSPVFVGAFRA
jgi:nucleoside-diphosphate-sugar epimerase